MKDATTPTVFKHSNGRGFISGINARPRAARSVARDCHVLLGCRRAIAGCQGNIKRARPWDREKLRDRRAERDSNEEKKGVRGEKKWSGTQEDEGVGGGGGVCVEGNEG